MDNAFRSHPYPGYTSDQLREFIAQGSSCSAVMAAEIDRRAEVAAGDMSRASDGERLRAADFSRAKLQVALQAASPKRPFAGNTDDIDGLPLFDSYRSPSFL